MKTASKRLMVYILVALLIFQNGLVPAYAQTVQPEHETQAQPLVEMNQTSEALPENEESSPQDTPDTVEQTPQTTEAQLSEESNPPAVDPVIDQQSDEETKDNQVQPAEEKEIRFHANVTLANRSHSLLYDVYQADGTPVQLGLRTAYDDPYVVLEPGDYYLTIQADQFVQNGITYDQFVSYTRDNHDSTLPTMTVNGDMSKGSFDSNGNFTLHFTAARNTWNTSSGMNYHRALAWLGFEAGGTRKITVHPRSNDYQTEGEIRKSLVSTYSDGVNQVVGGTTTVVPSGNYHVVFSGIAENMQAEAYLGKKRLVEGDLYTDVDQQIQLYVRPLGLPALPDDLTKYRIESLSLIVTPSLEGMAPRLMSGGIALVPTQADATRFQQVIDQRPYTVQLDGLAQNYKVGAVKLNGNPIDYTELSHNSFEFAPQFSSMFPRLQIELETVATHTVTYQVGETTTTETVADQASPVEVPAVNHRHYHSEWVDFMGWLDETGQAVEPAEEVITSDRTFTAQFVDKTALKLYKNQYGSIRNVTNIEVLDEVIGLIDIYLSQQSQTQAGVEALAQTYQEAFDQLILGHVIVISPRDENDKLIPRAHVILELLQDDEVKFSFDTSTMTATGSGSYNSPVIPNGEYVIREVKAPEGYQLADDVLMTINATNPVGYKATFWKPQHQKLDVTASFSFSRELDETVAVPEPMAVQPGETITLPAVKPDVTEKYSFLGWYYSTDTAHNKTLLQPGEEVVLHEDTEFIGLWEGNYGKAHLQFHTEEFTGDSWNRTHVGVPDLTGFSARVIRQDGQVYELTPVGEAQPGRMRYTTLSKGEYTIEIGIPEDYRLVTVKGWFSGQVVDVDLATESFMIPWLNNNMTLGPSYFVQVEPIEFAQVTFDAGGGTFKDDAETSWQVEVGSDISLPYDFSLGLKKPGQVFRGWLLEGTEDIYQPRSSYTVSEDVTFIAQWADVKGQLILFTVDKDLSDLVPEPYLIDSDGNEYELNSNSYTSRERWWRSGVESLLNGSYVLKFRGLEPGQTVVLEDAAPSLRSSVDISQNEDGEDVLTFDFDEGTSRSSRFVKVRATIIDPVTASFSFNRELDEAVAVPEPITVAPGESITLPSVTPDVTENYSFLGWYYSTDTSHNKTLLQPGEEVVLHEDTEFIGLWEGNYGKAHLQFHTEEFTGDSWNRTHVGVRDLSGFSARVIRQDGRVHELTPVGESYPGRMHYTRLSKGEYTIEIGIPENYRLIAVKAWVSGQVVDVDLATESFMIPWLNNNMTLGPSYFVQVEEVVPQDVIASFSFNRELDEAVAVPEPITVAPGETITLPAVTPDVTENYSFLGWYYSTDTSHNKTLLQPGEEVVLNEDTEFIGLWEGNYGKAHLQFHTEEFTGDSWNRTHVGVRDLTGFSARVIRQDGRVHELTPVGESYPGRMHYTRLSKGEYTIEIGIPENYQLIAVKAWVSGQVVDVDLATESFMIPWLNNNMTLGPSYFVQVEEVVPQDVTASFSFNRELDEAVAVPEPITVEPGEAITLPAVTPDVTENYSFLGWYYSTDTAHNKTLLQPGEEVVLNEDTEFIALWEGNYGKAHLQFHTEEFTGDSWNRTHVGVRDLSGFSARVIRQDGRVHELTPVGESYPGRMHYTRLSKGEYTIEIGIPEDYRLVAVKTWTNGQVVDVDLATETFSIPWFNNNMTLGPSYYVEVEKVVVPTFTVTYEAGEGEFDDDAETVVEVIAGSQIHLPEPDQLGLSRQGYVFEGWLLSQSNPAEIYQPGESYLVEADTTFIAQWKEIEESEETPSEPGDEETPSEPGDEETPSEPGDDEETPSEPGQKDDPKEDDKKSSDKKADPKASLPGTGMGDSTGLLIIALGLLISSLYLMRRLKTN